MDSKTEDKKTDQRPVWIRVLTTFAGRAGTFVAGEIRETTQAVLDAVQKELKLRRAALTQGERKRNPVFRYKKIIPPWDQRKDPLGEELSAAAQKLTTTQGELNRLRIRVDGLKKKKQQIDKDLAEFDKLKKADPSKPPVCHFIAKKRAMLTMIEADLELDAADIKEHEAATDKFAAMIKDREKQIADRSKKKRTLKKKQ